ncbi:beta-phosphoglucomutase [Vallitalea sp.]|jgi:beta-phosphoglucomutase|uniref:beta-phosphoglucomutase n=1 Tax=Vallitalea sp. TaxID=1882829 RepID=UPI0025FBC1A3|nr:beta-phosphoglucomutase [Vallitalea sp.]MCT4687658.1 beta-phosphoglucomutase [Vallitalea sp.]
MNNKYKLFIFDMDGVITETSEQHYQAWKQLAKEIGIEIDRKFNEKLKGVSRIESLERILEYANKTNDFTEDDKLELATRKNENYKEMILKFTEENLFEGVKDLFAELKKRNIKIAIGSASKNAPTLVRLLGIEADVDYIVNPAEVKRGKPAPDIFLKAAEHMGVDIPECIGVEDAEAGIEAIKSAGMFAVGIGDSKVLKKADIIYEQTKDIKLEDLM